MTSSGVGHAFVPDGAARGRADSPQPSMSLAEANVESAVWTAE